MRNCPIFLSKNIDKKNGFGNISLNDISYCDISLADIVQ